MHIPNVGLKPNIRPIITQVVCIEIKLESKIKKRTERKTVNGRQLSILSNLIRLPDYLNNQR